MEEEAEESRADEHDQQDNEKEEESTSQSHVGGDDFPTLELTLKEARRQYDDEERRRESVEGKIGIVVTADALIVSLGAALGQTIPILQLAIALLPALFSAALGLYTVRSQEYKRPGKEIMDFHDYADYETIEAQQEKLLLDYEITASDNRDKNDRKYTAFNDCALLTVVSLSFVLLALIASNTSIFNWICDFVPTLRVSL